MKKLLSSLLALCITVCCVQKSQAQVSVSYGPELGSAAFGIVDDGEVPYVGFDNHIGGAAHVQFGRFFAVRPTVFFKLGSFTDVDYTEEKLSLSRVGMVLPVMFSYNFESDHKLFVGAGPSLTCAVGGKFDDNGEKTKLKFGSSADDDMKKIDLGLQFQAGFQFNWGLSLSLYFNSGLTDLRPVHDDGYYSYGSLKTMDALGVSIGWMFGGKSND